MEIAAPIIVSGRPLDTGSGREVVAAPAEDQDRIDIQATLAGDGTAFERLVRRHQQAVAAWMWRFTRDKTTLEELTQEVLVQAYFSLPSFRGGSSFRTWLLAVATRAGYAFWKRTARDKKRGEEAALHLALERTANDDGPSEAAEALYGVLETLPPKERLVLTLMYFEEQSVAEIAAATGWSGSLVKVRAYRARRRLKELLVRDGQGR
jgi:RNA polymerase sigma-70 factor, ECF subfamily